MLAVTDNENKDNQFVRKVIFDLEETNNTASKEAPVKKHPKYLILDLLAANQVVQGLHFQELFLFNIIVKCEIGLSICNYKLIENKF